MRIGFLPLLLLACSVFTAAPPTGAQTARSGGAAPSAQAMQQLQQLAAERTALQAENARVKADLEAARKERDSLKAAQQSLAQRSRGAEAQLATTLGDKARLEGELARERQRVEELVQRLQGAGTTMREIETDRASKTRLLAQHEQELQVCRDHNRNLFALGTEVIDKLEDQGFWSGVAKREPFTQLKRVQLQNLADGYRGTAEDNRLADPLASAGKP